MIRSNRETIKDRQLFNTVHKHHRVSELHCEPHLRQGEGIAGARDQMMALFTCLWGLMERFQGRVVRELEILGSRVQEVMLCMKRVDAVVKFKRDNRLYSFANSPISKSKTPSSGKKYKPDQQPSTQPRTHNRTQPQYQSPQNPKKNENTFFDANLQYLHEEIKQLKRYIDIAHAQTSTEVLSVRESKERLILEENFYQESVKRLRDQLQVQDGSGEAYRDAQRYRAIVVQYRKQEQRLQLKIDRYRNALQSISSWLKKLKSVQLPAYLPCQACKLKAIIEQYLNESPTTKSTNQTGKPSPQPQPQAQQYSEYDYEVGVTEFNENLSDQDELLMQYDEGGSEIDS